jgi:hypothetical protein
VPVWMAITILRSTSFHLSADWDDGLEDFSCKANGKQTGIYCLCWCGVPFAVPGRHSSFTFIWWMEALVYLPRLYLWLYMIGVVSLKELSNCFGKFLQFVVFFFYALFICKDGLWFKIILTGF